MGSCKLLTPAGLEQETITPTVRLLAKVDAVEKNGMVVDAASRLGANLPFK